MKSTWVQPPGDNSNIDPVLLNEDRLAHQAAASQNQPSQAAMTQSSQGPLPRERSFGSDIGNLREFSSNMYTLYSL